MTTTTNTYGNYFASNVVPNLNECTTQETVGKDKFNVFTKAGINDDPQTLAVDESQATSVFNYVLDNQYGCDCGLKEARDIQVSQPGINFKGGVGWIAEKGCLVDNDTELRQDKQKLTNPNYIHQITERFTGTTPGLEKGYHDVDVESLMYQSKKKLTNPHEIHQITSRLSATTPNLSKGYFDVDVESVIRPGNFTTDQRPCGPLSGVSTLDKTFTPMVPKLKKEVQDPIHIIPEDSKHDWVRGGLPTPEMVRNKDYLRRYQQKTFRPN